MADSIPSNGDKSTNEQDNSHNNFHLLVSKQEFLFVIITEGENPCKPKIKYIGASCILQSRELTKKDTSGRFEFLLT